MERHIYVGKPPVKIPVSEADYAYAASLLKREGEPFAVTDLSTGTPVVLRVVACSLPRCFCAVDFAERGTC